MLEDRRRPRKANAHAEYRTDPTRHVPLGGRSRPDVVIANNGCGTAGGGCATSRLRNESQRRLPAGTHNGWPECSYRGCIASRATEYGDAPGFRGRQGWSTERVGPAARFR